VSQKQTVFGQLQTCPQFYDTNRDAYSNSIIQKHGRKSSCS